METDTAVVELSSDSSAPASPVKNGNDECDRIAALINKYKCEGSTIRKLECISDSGEETVLVSDVNEDKNSFDENVQERFSSLRGFAVLRGDSRVINTAGHLETISSDSDDSITSLTISKKPKKRNSHTGDKSCEKPFTKKRKAPVDKETKKLEKAALQQKKQEEREQKKQEAMHEKQLKRALSAVNKNIKPNECIKCVTVHIDPEILNEPYATEILTHLKSIEAQYKIEAQIIPYTITWKRQTQNHKVDDNGQLISSTEITDTEDVLIFMDWKQVVSHVHENSLLTFVKNVAAVHGNKRVYLAIFGLEPYFNYLKRAKKKDITDTGQSQKISKTDRVYAEAPLVNKKKVEYALTELQVFCNCYHRMVETTEDVALVVGQFSKSIAQVPYKLEKNLKYQEIDHYMAGDNRDTVTVDKDGNGLQRLWNQQLCCFPLARLETAEAIASQYPTPATLIQAYRNCSSKEEGERLLQDIPIRRAAGPMTTVRKIGIELSRKLFTFFTSIDENAII